MDSNVPTKNSSDMMGLGDTRNRDALLQRYTNEIARQKGEITRLQEEVKLKDQSLRKKNDLIREQDAEVTRLNLKEPENAECKNCIELRNALEEFQEVIEKEFGNFKTSLTKKDTDLMEAKVTIEEAKLKLTSSRNENFTFKKQIRDLKKQIDSLGCDKQLPTSKFPEVYLLACRESLKRAFEAVANNDSSDHDNHDQLRTSTATLCGYFDRLLEHCCICSCQETDSGMEVSDCENKSQRFHPPQSDCGGCKSLKGRYLSLCEVNERLVNALMSYEDMTLLLNVTSPKELLWGPAFSRVMKVIADLDKPSCTSMFSQTWETRIGPQLKKLKTKVEERAKRGHYRNTTDSSATESSPKFKKRRRNSSESTIIADYEPVVKKEKTPSPEPLPVPTLSPDSLPVLPQSESVRSRSRSTTPASSCEVLVLSPPRILISETTASPDTNNQRVYLSPSQGLSIPVVNIHSDSDETVSVKTEDIDVPESQAQAQEKANFTSPYRINPDVLKKMQAEAPKIIAKSMSALENNALNEERNIKMNFLEATGRFKSLQKKLENDLIVQYMNSMKTNQGVPVASQNTTHNVPATQYLSAPALPSVAQLQHRLNLTNNFTSEVNPVSPQTSSALDMVDNYSPQNYPLLHSQLKEINVNISQQFDGNVPATTCSSATLYPSATNSSRLRSNSASAKTIDALQNHLVQQSSSRVNNQPMNSGTYSSITSRNSTQSYQQSFNYMNITSTGTSSLRETTEHMIPPSSHHQAPIYGHVSNPGLNPTSTMQRRVQNPQVSVQSQIPTLPPQNHSMQTWFQQQSHAHTGAFISNSAANLNHGHHTQTEQPAQNTYINNTVNGYRTQSERPKHNDRGNVHWRMPRSNIVPAPQQVQQLQNIFNVQKK